MWWYKVRDPIQATGRFHIKIALDLGIVKDLGILAILAMVGMVAPLINQPSLRVQAWLYYAVHDGPLVM